MPRRTSWLIPMSQSGKNGTIPSQDAFVCLCMPLRFSGNVHNGPKKLGLVFKRDSQQDVRVFKLQNQNRYDGMSVLTPDSLWDSGCAAIPVYTNYCSLKGLYPKDSGKVVQ